MGWGCGSLSELVEHLLRRLKALGSILQYCKNRVWWCLLEILAFGKWREDVQGFKVIFGCIVGHLRPSLKQKNTHTHAHTPQQKEGRLLQMLEIAV